MAVSTKAERTTFSPGTAVILKGAVNQGWFYLVLKGKLCLQSERDYDEHALSRFEQGDTFGIVSALTGQPYMCTILAETPVEILRVPITRLGEFFSSENGAVLKILRRYTNELRALNRQLAADTGKSTQSPADLFMDSQDYEKMEQPKMAAWACSAFLEWIKEHPSSPAASQRDAAEQALGRLEKHYRPVTFNERKAELDAGDVVFLQKEPAAAFYVVEQGSVKISRKKGNEEFILAILRPGQIFGEMALLDEEYRAASAVAFSDSRILQFSIDSLFESSGPVILQRLFESLARRIWYSHQRARLLDITDPIAKLYMYLQILVSDTQQTSGSPGQESYIFNFSIAELEKMTDTQAISKDEMTNLLADENIEIGRHTIKVLNKRRLDDKVFQYKKELRVKSPGQPLYA